MTSTGTRQLLGHLPADFTWRPALRLCVLVSRTRLDAQLAAGVDPGRTARLELRARQLLRPSYRQRLAAGIDQRLMDALRGPYWSPAIPVAREQVAAASENLLALAQILRAPERVDPRGVAMVRQLLCDGGSPLYVGTFPGALEHRTQVALNCLVGQPWANAPGGEPLLASIP